MRSAGCEPVLLEGFLDAPGGGMGSDALIDGECLLQVGGGLAAVPVVEVAAAGSFEGAGLFQRRANVAGDGQRLPVVVAGLAGGCGGGQQVADAVEYVCLDFGFAGDAEHLEGLLVAGRGRSVVAGQLLDAAEFDAGGGLAGAVAEVAELLDGLLVAGGSGRVVASQPVQHSELPDGKRLIASVAEITE